MIAKEFCALQLSLLKKKGVCFPYSLACDAIKLKRVLAKGLIQPLSAATYHLVARTQKPDR